MKKPPARRSRYRLTLIRKRYQYEVQEVARLLTVSKGTVRQWIKAGLPVIDTQRPTLIKGQALWTFLGERQQSKRTRCSANQMYCLKCRAPHRPFGLMVDVTFRNAKTAQISGLCEVCSTRMNRTASVAKLSEALKAFDQHTLRNPHLTDSPSPSLKPDSKERDEP